MSGLKKTIISTVSKALLIGVFIILCTSSAFAYRRSQNDDRYMDPGCSFCNPAYRRAVVCYEHNACSVHHDPSCKAAKVTKAPKSKATRACTADGTHHCCLHNGDNCNCNWRYNDVWECNSSHYHRHSHCH